MGMTREQVRKAIGEGATDAMVDAILNMHSSDIGGLKGQVADLQGQLRDTNDALSATKSQLDEASKANMSAEEQLQAAIAEAEKTRIDFARKSARLDAEQVFVEAGLAKEDYADVLAAIVTEDAKATVKTAQAMARLVAARVEATEEATRRKVLGDTPKPDGNDGEKPVTKEEFDSMTYQQQLAFKSENPDAFAEFIKS